MVLPCRPACPTFPLLKFRTRLCPPPPWPGQRSWGYLCWLPLLHPSIQPIIKSTTFMLSLPHILFHPGHLLPALRAPRLTSIYFPAPGMFFYNHTLDVPLSSLLWLFMDLEFNLKFLMTLTYPSGLQVPVQLPWLCCLTLMVHGFINVGFLRGLHGGQSRPQSTGLNTILPVQGWILEPVPTVGMEGRTYIQRTQEGWGAFFCLGSTHRCGGVLSMTFYRWPAAMVSFAFSERYEAFRSIWLC